MYRSILAALVVLSITSSAAAVTPQFWRTRTADEFFTGETEGFAITARGELRPAPAVTRVATFTDPFVLSQAEAPNGDRFFGTGNDGKVYRLRGSELKPLFTAQEPEIYALAYRDGAIYAASSPNGKIYRIEPDSGKSSVFYDPGQAYIWAMAVSGNDLIVATGVDGKLFRVGPNGEGRVLFDSEDTHLRSLAVRADGSMLAGGASKARIYEVSRSGEARAIYDSSLSEISSIYIDANGTGWAGGVTTSLPASAPARPQQQPAQQGTSSNASTSTASGSGETKSTAAAPEVSFSFDDGTASAQPGTSELYQISSDGYVQVARKLDREMIYSIGPSPNGGILISTGPQGRLYELRDSELSLVAVVPEKQIVSISRGKDATLITTTNSGAVYRMTDAPSATAEYRSTVRDMERFSRFGAYQLEGNRLPGNVAVSFRSGNTRTPDSTWSAWSQPRNAVEGSVDAPPARYLQWKVTLANASRDVVLDNVNVAYVNRNIAPEIEFVTVQDPAVVFISASYPASPQLVEATNPDENGIFSSIDAPRANPADPGKRAFRKGFRTITWRAKDENSDALRYTLEFRPKGSGNWLRMRENLDDLQFNFDTSQLSDGVYEVRLTATDAPDNPTAPLTATRSGIEFTVDNTSPAVSVSKSGAKYRVRVQDSLSPIGRLEYSTNAEKWVRVAPLDGIADSADETFELDAKDVDGRFVVVRAVDGFFNVGTKNVSQ